MSKGWHIVKKFIPRAKYKYTPMEDTPRKTISVEVPGDYKLLFWLSEHEPVVIEGPCRVDLDPNHLHLSEETQLILQKKVEQTLDPDA